MIYSSLAVKYAKALFEAGKEAKALEGVKKTVDDVMKLIKAEKHIIDILKSPLLSRSRKLEFIRALKEVVDIHPLVFNLLGILVDKKRVYLLEPIIKTFNELYLEEKGVRVVHLTVAREISKEEEEEIKQRLEEVLGGEVYLQIEIERSLIGGMVFRYRDFMVDNSVRKLLMDVKDAIISS